MEELYKFDLFDRYLRGELEEQELDDFLERLKSSPELQEELDMHQFLVEGIREHEKKELKGFIAENTRVKPIASSWSRSWTYASAAVLLAFGVLYIVLENRAQNNLAGNEPPAAPKPKAEKEATDQIPENIPEEVKPDTVSSSHSFISGDTAINEFEDEPVEPEAPDFPEMQFSPNGYASSKGQGTGEDRMGNGEGDNLPVKTDIRLFDTLFTLSILLENGVSDSLEASPQSRQEVAVLNEKIQVQFWKSPINYKGYRFNGRKLEVFGLDTMTKVSIKYLVVDPALKVYDLYLVYGTMHVKLIDDNRYHAYIRETNPTILNELK